MSDISGVESNTEANAKGTTDELKQLREDLARMSSIVEELVRRRAGEAVDHMARRAGRVWEDAGRLTGDAQRVIEKNPVATVGGAFGIGLLLGMLFGRR